MLSDIPNATPGWAVVSGDIKIVGSAIANENPKGTVPPGESFLQGDVKYESLKGNVRIYSPIVTSEVSRVMHYRDIDRYAIMIFGTQIVCCFLLAALR